MTYDIYLAGPMRGHPLYNFPAFFKAAMALRKAGHYVISPAERDMAEGFNPGEPLDSPANSEIFNLGETFAWDFKAIMETDAVVLLPGWRESKGVQAELVLAMALERPIFEIQEDGALHPLELTEYTVQFDVG
jgi:nucleoside 2-deoxyribosyltransferase